MFKSIIKSGILAIFAIAASTAIASAETRIHGSSTVAKAVLAPNLAKIQSETGLQLKIVANGSGNGLKDLSAGRADIAMISAPIEAEAKNVNEAAPGSLDISAMQTFPIGYSTINFTVHASNPVRSLTEDQIRGILTGDIANWSEVGGENKPIVVVAEAEGQGTRSSVETLFMNGDEITGKGRIFPSLSQVGKVASQIPTSFSYGNATSILPGTYVIPGIEVQQPLSLVTRGAPSADARKLIDVAASIAR